MNSEEEFNAPLIGSYERNEDNEAANFDIQRPLLPRQGSLVMNRRQLEDVNIRTQNHEAMA